MQGSHQQPGPEGSQLQLLAATHTTSCINALRPCILLPLAHPKGRFSDPENGGERRCASVSKSQVRALVLPVSTVYSRAQGAFLIGRRRGFVCLFFSAHFWGRYVIFSHRHCGYRNTTTARWNFQMCLRASMDWLCVRSLAAGLPYASDF